MIKSLAAASEIQWLHRIMGGKMNKEKMNVGSWRLEFWSIAY